MLLLWKTLWIPSPLRELISLLADKDAEIERLREVINSMPDLDPGNLDHSQTSPKQIQLLLDELETKTQELDDLKASMGSMGNTMTNSKRSLAGEIEEKDRSRAATLLLQASAFLKILQMKMFG